MSESMPVMDERLPIQTEKRREKKLIPDSLGARRGALGMNKKRNPAIGRSGDGRDAFPRPALIPRFPKVFIRAISVIR